MEYLKNIILQFLKCRPNERDHLVPVLSTMLKLSQEEKDLVIQQARGDFNDESSQEQVVFRGQGYTNARGSLMQEMQTNQNAEF